MGTPRPVRARPLCWAPPRRQPQSSAKGQSSPPPQPPAQVPAPGRVTFSALPPLWEPGVCGAERWPPALSLPRSRSGGSGSGAAPAPCSRRCRAPGAASSPSARCARVAPVSSRSYFLSRPQPSPHPPLPPRPPLRAAPRGAPRRGLPSPPSPRLLPPRRGRRRLLFAPLFGCPPAAPTSSPPSLQRPPPPMAGGKEKKEKSAPQTQLAACAPRRGPARIAKGSDPVPNYPGAASASGRARATPGSGLSCASGQRIRVAISSARPRLPRSATKMHRSPHHHHFLSTSLSPPVVPGARCLGAGGLGQDPSGSTAPGPRALCAPAPRRPATRRPGLLRARGGGGGEADFNHCHFI